MMAIVAAVVFGLALLLDLAGATLGGIAPGTVVTLGLLLLALHLAGIGAARRSGSSNLTGQRDRR